jgi:hypothetical protein
VPDAYVVWFYQFYEQYIKLREVGVTFSGTNLVSHLVEYGQLIQTLKRLILAQGHTHSMLDL